MYKRSNSYDKLVSSNPKMNHMQDKKEEEKKDAQSFNSEEDSDEE